MALLGCFEIMLDDIRILAILIVDLFVPILSLENVREITPVVDGSHIREGMDGRDQDGLSNAISSLDGNDLIRGLGEINFDTGLGRSDHQSRDILQLDVCYSHISSQTSYYKGIL